ncbi:MAG: carbonic anhydrase [Bacteriovoracaceae bacterium]
MKMRTKVCLAELSTDEAVNLLKDGNKRFINNLRFNRNLLQQVNDTIDQQYPFAVIISCMDSRTSAELIFDQGLGDIFSIRVAGNIINEEILGSAEFACKVVGAKVVMVLGHSGCTAILGAVNKVDIGHMYFITDKIKRCIDQATFEPLAQDRETLLNHVTRKNVFQGIADLKNESEILRQMAEEKKIKILGGVYDVSSGLVDFFE